MAKDQPNGQPKVSAIPADRNRVTPFVVVRGAAGFLDFVTRVFRAEVTDRQEDEHGRIIHAEVRIGDSVLMPVDAEEGWPDTFLYLAIYVEDCDQTHHEALEAGAVEVTPLLNSPWGDRGSRIRDPWGNIWAIQSRVEQVGEEEMVRRFADPTYLAVLDTQGDTLDRELSSRKQKQLAQ